MSRLSFKFQHLTFATCIFRKLKNDCYVVVVLLNKAKLDLNRYHSSLHISVLKASWTAQTFLCVILWAYLHRLHSPSIVFRVIPTLQINSCLLSGSYQVHLYVKYKYLHYKYIRGRLGPLPKHGLPFAVQIVFHFAPLNVPSPLLKRACV